LFSIDRVTSLIYIYTRQTSIDKVMLTSTIQHECLQAARQSTFPCWGMPPGVFHPRYTASHVSVNNARTYLLGSNFAGLVNPVNLIINAN